MAGGAGEWEEAWAPGAHYPAGPTMERNWAETCLRAEEEGEKAPAASEDSVTGGWVPPTCTGVARTCRRVLTKSLVIMALGCPPHPRRHLCQDSCCSLDVGERWLC